MTMYAFFLFSLTKVKKLSVISIFLDLTHSFKEIQLILEYECTTVVRPLRGGYIFGVLFLYFFFKPFSHKSFPFYNLIFGANLNIINVDPLVSGTKNKILLWGPLFKGIFPLFTIIALGGPIFCLQVPFYEISCS